MKERKSHFKNSRQLISGRFCINRLETIKGLSVKEVPYLKGFSETLRGEYPEVSENIDKSAVGLEPKIFDMDKLRREVIVASECQKSGALR